MTNDELVNAYVAAFRAADPDAVRELIAPGAVFWHNFDQRDRDMAASLGELARMNDSLADMHMEIVERFALADGVGVRLVLRGTIRASGEPFESHQAKFFRIGDAGITRIEEYVAPAGMVTSS
jgi:ketosteroid isomerase-like protein